MIKLIRLDERLIHGQVAIRWSKYLGVDRILVLNDEAAKNAWLKNFNDGRSSRCKSSYRNTG
jgi:PTS system mannose-specific IIB component